MKQKRNILLISYSFPPEPGIGGRRWAKFAKYLSMHGYIVHVILSKADNSQKSLWINDVADDENIIMYTIRSCYPKILNKTPKNLYEKLRYKLSLIFVSILSKGTPYDRGWMWNRRMLRLANHLLKKNIISNVIVSSAPFSSAYSAVKLKKSNNDLNLIVDFRDPWTWGNAYGMNLISSKRKQFEENQERLVVEYSNFIFSPSDVMINHLKNKYARYSNKFFLLPHGYDKDEFLMDNCFISEKNERQIRMLMYGTLYPSQENIYSKLASFLSEHNMKLDIYSTDVKYKSFLENNLNIKYNQAVTPKEIFKIINSYDFVLIIQPIGAKDYITTKIYEIVYAKVPILLISVKGELSKFILENKLGYWIDVDTSSFTEDMEAVFANWKHPCSNKFPIHKYEYNEITKNLISFFK